MLKKIVVGLIYIPLIALLTACGTSQKSGKYYENDGPPPNAGAWKNEAPDAVPKLEPPVNSANKPYKVLGKNYYPQTGDKALVQTGYGSWYGKQFHGKKTSIGETYDMYQMSAAHTTMELPSYARVTNLENGKSVVVRVNDRGPFLHGRIIDLSYAAAHKLGYANKGTAKLKVERITRREIAKGSYSTKVPAVLAAAPAVKPAQAAPVSIPPVQNMPSPAARAAGKKFIQEGVFTLADGGESVEETRVEMAPTQAAGNRYCIQLGVFRNYDNAERLLRRAKAEIDPQLSSNGRIIEVGGLYKVLIGRDYLPDQAHDLAEVVKNRLGSDVYVVKE